MNKVLTSLLFLSSLALASQLAVASEYGSSGETNSTDASASMPVDFFVGDYVVVGKLPDDGAAYSGSASLVAEGANLTMRILVDDKISIAKGRIEVPEPPGEGSVLRFVDIDNEWKSNCLWDTDLDNYPRLTCYKLFIGSSHSEPGLESLFPTGAWPEQVSKRYAVPDQ